MGDLKGSRLVYLQACADTNFDDYVEFEPAMRYAYLENRYGYRGHHLKAWVYSNQILPHLSVIRSIGREFSKPTDLAGRIATINFANVMGTKSRCAIQLYVASSMINEAMAGKETIIDSSHLERIDANAKKFALQVGPSASLDASLSLVKTVFSHLPDREQSDSDMVLLISSMRPAVSAASLLSLLLLLPVLGLGWLKSKRENFAAASPYLLWLMAPAISVTFDTSGSVAGNCIIGTLLFIPALTSKARRWTDILGILFAVAVFWISWSGDNGFGLTLSASVFLIGLWAERRSDRFKTGLVWVGVPLACAISACLWIGPATHFGGLSGWAYGLLSLIGGVGLVTLPTKIKWQAVAGCSCLVLGVWFATMVTRDIAADRALTTVCDHLLNDAEEIRSPRK
jgi:hypothetical protein